MFCTQAKVDSGEDESGVASGGSNNTYQKPQQQQQQQPEEGGVTTLPGVTPTGHGSENQGWL